MDISYPADRLTPGYVPMIDGAALPGVTPFLTFHEQILIPIEAWDHKDELLRLNPGDTIVNVFPWIITLTPDP